MYNKKSLDLAIDMAKSAYDLNNYPVGAVLTINNKLIGKGENKITEKSSHLSHAEMRAITDSSVEIYKSKKEDESNIIRLYTTLEPCIQCFGASAANKVDEIYYIVNDPHGGASGLSQKGLGSVYQTRWPKVFQIDHSPIPFDLMLKFFRREVKDGNKPWAAKMLELYGC